MIKEIKITRTQFDEIRKGKKLILLYDKEECMNYEVGDIVRIYSLNKEFRKSRYYFHAQIEKVKKKETDDLDAFILHMKIRIDMPVYLPACKGCDDYGV